MKLRVAKKVMLAWCEVAERGRVGSVIRAEARLLHSRRQRHWLAANSGPRRKWDPIRRSSFLTYHAHARDPR